MRIKILSNTAASGVTFKQGMILKTPDDLSQTEAETLILHRRAIKVVDEEELTSSGS